MTQSSLTAPERETIILTNDDSDCATIETFQRTMITKLRRNRSAKLIDQGRRGDTAWARFEIPARLLRFGNERPKRVPTPAQRAVVAKLTAKTRAAA